MRTKSRAGFKLGKCGSQQYTLITLSQSLLSDVVDIIILTKLNGFSNGSQNGCLRRVSHQKLHGITFPFQLQTIKFICYCNVCLYLCLNFIKKKTYIVMFDFIVYLIESSHNMNVSRLQLQHRSHISRQYFQLILYVEWGTADQLIKRIDFIVY